MSPCGDPRPRSGRECFVMHANLHERTRGPLVRTNPTGVRPNEPRKQIIFAFQELTGCSRRPYPNPLPRWRAGGGAWAAGVACSPPLPSTMVEGGVRAPETDSDDSSSER